jgi:hypothetical protein
MQRFEPSLKDRESPVQLLLPAVEIAAAMREGVGELIRRAGLELISLLMEQEVKTVVGKRHAPAAGRKANRWGQDKGWCRIAEASDSCHAFCGVCRLDFDGWIDPAASTFPLDPPPDVLLTRSLDALRTARLLSSRRRSL